MPPGNPDRCQQPRTALLVLAVSAFMMPTVRADDAPPAGMIVPIRPDHMWHDAQRLELAVKKPLRRFETWRGLDPTRKEVFKIICDFNPDGQPSASDRYEDCLKLARMLRKLQNERGVLTVAWVHGEVSRHSVLPVLACDERVFSDDDSTKIGKIIDRGGTPLEPGQVAEYRQIVAGRSTWPCFVQKMYDRELLVVKVDRGGLKPEDQYRGVPPKKENDGKPELGVHDVLVPNLDRGSTALYTFAEASKFGLCLPTAVLNAPELRKHYDLPESAVLRQTEQPIVCRIVLTGTVGGGLKEQFQRRLDRARGQKVDIVILQIGCGDGDIGTAAEMARAILALGDPSNGRTVETIAYVQPEARNTAVLLALACDRIVMHSRAELGNFDRFLDGRQDEEFEARARLIEVAEKQGVPPALARALATRNAHLHWVSSVKGDTDRTFLEQSRFDADQARPERRWKSIEELRAQKGGYLTLSAETALKYGVSDKTADDWTGACEWAGIEAKDVRLVGNDLLDQVAEFLREPITQGILIMLAITCLLLELKMPGTAVPGIISAVCFVLFFWSQSQFNEETTTLALLLFLLGLVLIALEVFVIPGFGVTGVSGIMLVIGSLGLMAYGHWPRSGEDWVGLGRSLAPIGFSLCGGIALAFLAAHYLPHIPGANRLLISPEGQTADGEEAQVSSAGTPDLSSLLGAIGVAVSSLRPAGKMQIGDEFVDVVAEGGYIAPGTRVQVIEIEGNRVVVKEV